MNFLGENLRSRYREWIKETKFMIVLRWTKGVGYGGGNHRRRVRVEKRTVLQDQYLHIQRDVLMIRLAFLLFFILKKIINLHLCPLKLILPITANFVVVAVLGMFYFWKTCAFLNSSNHNQIKILWSTVGILLWFFSLGFS